MANCVNCGRETEKGQFFCPECLKAMTPQEGGKPAAEAAPAPQEETAAPAKKARRAEKQEAEATPVDAVRAAVLTPPSAKKAIKQAPAIPEKKPKPPREGPKATERAKKAAGVVGRGGKRAALFFKRMAMRFGRWLKALATRKNYPYGKEDLVACIIGITASLLLVVSTFFTGLLRFGWMPVNEEAFEAIYSTLKAKDLGFFGYAAMVLSVLISLLCIWNIISSRLEKGSIINPAFVVVVLCIITIAVIPLALASNSAIVRSSAGDASMTSNDLGYANKQLLYGSYVALLSLIVIFIAAAANLAEEKELPKWMIKLFSLKGLKKKGFKRNTPDAASLPGKHYVKKGGRSA